MHSEARTVGHFALLYKPNEQTQENLVLQETVTKARHTSRKDTCCAQNNGSLIESNHANPHREAKHQKDSDDRSGRES